MELKLLPEWQADRGTELPWVVVNWEQPQARSKVGKGNLKLPHYAKNSKRR